MRKTMVLALTGRCGLIFGATGIYATFLYCGNLNEDIFTYKASDGTMFRHSWFLQTVESSAGAAVGFAGMVLSGRTERLPLGLVAVSGAAQVTAKVCTSMSLASGLSFPVAILAKSAKMAPVMLGTLLVGGDRYSVREYVQVMAIITGTTMVSMRSSGSGAASTLVGFAYISASLALDGCTGGVQSKLRRQCVMSGTPLKPYELMFWTTFFMTAIAVVVTGCTGEFTTGVEFLVRNPVILTKISQFATCSAVGQFFVFFTLVGFGPMKVAAITTTRKIFSVLLSIALKGHPMPPFASAGVAIAFAGIVCEMFQRDEVSRKVEPGHAVATAAGA